MSADRRRLRTKKILVASLGIATLSYGIIGCDKQYPVGNLMPPRDLPDAATQPVDASFGTTDAGSPGVNPDGRPLDPKDIVTSGNLMPPPQPDAGARKTKK